jgi:hypothetical protein
MKAQGKAAFTNARKTVLPPDLAHTLDTATVEFWASLVEKPRRRLDNVLYDCSFIVAGWLLLIGLIQYPIAHLIGLVVSSLALVVVGNKGAHLSR